MVTKDIAKFLSGAAAMEVVNHTILALNSLLPMHIFGLVISKTANYVILASWIVVFAGSFYLGWMKK